MTLKKQNEAIYEEAKHDYEYISKRILEEFQQCVNNGSVPTYEEFRGLRCDVEYLELLGNLIFEYENDNELKKKILIDYIRHFASQAETEYAKNRLTNIALRFE